ncbi:hypothetical protein [Streptomyces sp. NPDC056255]|uniref:hypothetical protein n=1 Tax=Streptomyces sp. NPDC056255 TaxID=3345764 RepID=UPI0035DAEDC0
MSWSVGWGSAPARLDLQTRNAFDASIFYAEIFDWARPPGGCTVGYALADARSRRNPGRRRLPARGGRR